MIEHWRQSFERDPERAVADLMSGRAGLGSDLRLDVPELLYEEFPDRPDEAQARQRLDGALFSWLHAMRRDYAAQVRRLGYAVYGKRLCDALTAVHLLDLPRTNRQVRETLDGWLRWLLPLRLAPERDPALECRRVLTRRQGDGAQTAAWLHLAADPRPEYLIVALAGLQGLPNSGDARANQVLMLHGLLRHALAGYATPAEGRAFFNRQFGALRGRLGAYPRAPNHWQQVLAEALDSFVTNSKDRNTGAEDPKARELAELIRDAQAKGLAAKGRRGRAFKPASKETREALERDIEAASQPVERLAERLFAMLEQHRRYAETTGDSYFFVRTLHNLGSRLMARADLPGNVLARFGQPIERAIAWEPTNPFCWTLWADWLAAQGYGDAREWVLRETVRLFPDDEPSRVELARLLIRRGEDRWDEAERWLREAAERSPSHEPSRVVLARLLVRRNRKPEALDLLDTFLAGNPDNAVARQTLERLRADAGGWDLAGSDDPLHEDAPAGFPTAGPDAHPTSSSPSTPATPDGLEESLPAAGALAEVARRARLGAEFARSLAGVDRTARVPPSERIAAQALAGDALAGLYYQWLQPEDAPESPPHAWAWRAARLWQTEAPMNEWDGLDRDCPERRRETGFLHLLTPLPDSERVRKAENWSRRYGEPGDSTADPIGAFMRRVLALAPELSREQRADSALAVLASAALGAPEMAA